MKRIIHFIVLIFFFNTNYSFHGGTLFASGTDNNRKALDSIGKLLEQMKDQPMCQEKARSLRNYAYTADKLGLTEEAQRYAIQAYQAFIDMHEYGWASLCLYERYIAYHSIGDTTHMAELSNELRMLADKDSSALTQYNYYAILFTRYMALAMETEEMAEREDWRGKTEEAGRKCIYYMERIADYKTYNIMPVWSYYNHALVYDLLYSPPLTDSISRYLAMAERSAGELDKQVDYQEAAISIRDERAWLYYYDKDYALAEQEMKSVLALIDIVAQISPATVITERGDAYAFLVELYSVQGRYAEALAYQQLLTENNRQHYDVDRQRVLDDIQTKYEVAQQQLVLERQKRINGLVLGGLVTSVVLLLFIAAVLLAVWYRKKQTEEALYVKALEADNMYNELQKALEDNSVEPLEVMRENLLRQIGELPSKIKYKADAIRQVQTLDIAMFKTAIRGAKGLSVMDKRYLMCFAAGLTAEQTADIFCISPASVYTVRYRIRKKFMSETAFVW